MFIFKETFGIQVGFGTIHSIQYIQILALAQEAGNKVKHTKQNDLDEIRDTKKNVRTRSFHF